MPKRFGLVDFQYSLGKTTLAMNQPIGARARRERSRQLAARGFIDFPPPKRDIHSAPPGLGGHFRLGRRLALRS
jgi:hypothetical protein